MTDPSGGADEVAECIDPLLERVEVGVVGGVAQIDAVYVSSPADELRLLVLGEHPTIGVYDECWHLDLLPLASTRLSDRRDRGLHHVGVEPGAQPVGTLLEVLHPSALERPIAARRSGLGAAGESTFQDRK